MPEPARICPSCRAESPPQARFCMECGGEFPETKARISGPRGERRQLTVMFCDLVGSSALAEGLDPEVYREVVRAYQTACHKTFERYDGHVAQYLGDGVLVYFGYPQAHEDDAERAVRSGLELFSELGRLNEELEQSLHLRVSVRVGVHTGPVVVGEMGAGGRRETLALGDTTNVAARLEGVASPDSLVISDATLRLVAGLFLTHDLGTPPLKGISEPVRAYHVLRPSGVRSRLDAANHWTPLVGRQREIARLMEGWESARDGAGRVARVYGEAGVGKSRVAKVVRERLAGESHTWLECHCSPFASSSALQPVIELVKYGLGFTEEATPNERIERLAGALEQSGLDSPEIVPLFCELLSLPLPEGSPYRPLRESPEMLRRRTFDALLCWILALSEQQPVVLLFEDLHWSDPSTLELLGLVLQAAAEAPILCMLTHRPEFEVPWQEEEQELAHLFALELTRLAPAEVRELAEKASCEPLPAEVLDRIAARADGIPLFAEELIRMVVDERGASGEIPSDLAVPATLQDSLMARLDRLGSAKAVAQLAATLGREFSYPLLAAIAERDEAPLRRALGRLVDAGLVYADGAEFTFKHALIQDVAYHSLLKSERRQVHGRIARALESQFSERAEAEPERLARHWLGAEEWLLAAIAFDRAGRRAGQRAAYQEALAHYRRGLAALEEAGPGSERDQRELSLQIMLGNAMMAAQGYAASETLPIWERGCVLAEALGDLEELSSALNGVATYHVLRGDCETAVAQAERILEIAERHGVRIAALRGHSTMAQARFYLGQAEQTLLHAETAISIYRPSDFREVTYGLGSDQGVIARGFEALALCWLGRFDRALAEARAGVELAEQIDSHLSLAMAMMFQSVTHSQRGESELALRTADAVAALSRELHFPYWLGFALLQSGLEITRLSGAPEGLERVTEGLTLLGRLGNQGGASFGLATLAEAQLNTGQLEAAFATVAAGVALATKMGQPYLDSELLRLQAEIRLTQGAAHRPESEALLREALRRAVRLGARGHELRAATQLARLLADDGRGQEARDLLAPLHASFTEGFDTRDLRAARSVLDSLA